MFRNQHGGGNDLTTAVHVTNLGGQATTASLTIMDSMGRTIQGCTGCTVNLPAGGGALWWSPEMPELEHGMYGSARVTADQPVGVVVNDISGTSAVDMASYVGLGQTVGSPWSQVQAYSPLFLYEGTRAPATRWQRYLPGLVKGP
jgi:hypothetical protein